MRKELNWSALLEDKLAEEDMNKIRGGDVVEDPNGPIIK
jgi:hypothetical protein